MKKFWALLSGLLIGTGAARGDDFRDLLEKRSYSDAKGNKLLYRMLAPEKTGDAKVPLVIFLHGAGERGNDNNAQLVHGVKEFVKNREKYPCYLIAPQCPRNQFWANVNWSSKAHDLANTPAEPMRLTLELVDSLMKELPIDPDRVYITGLSMGGYGTWDALARRPDFFAAAVPVCGGADTKTAEKIKHVPVWVFHGDEDRAVPVSRSRDIVEALKKAGGQPKYSEYKGVGHNSWDKAYADQEMFAWLFAQKRGKK